MMNRRIAMMAAVFVAASSVLSAADFRVDFDSRTSGIDLEVSNAENQLKVIYSGWDRERARQYVEVRGKLSGEWREYSIAFTPKKDGDVRFLLRSPYTKAPAVPQFVAYDDVRVEGADPLRNGGFEEKPGAGGGIGGWGAPANLLQAGDGAAEGKQYIIAAYQSSAVKKLTVKANVPVTLKFKAKETIR